MGPSLTAQLFGSVSLGKPIVYLERFATWQKCDQGFQSQAYAAQPQTE